MLKSLYGKLYSNCYAIPTAYEKYMLKLSNEWEVYQYLLLDVEEEHPLTSVFANYIDHVYWCILIRKVEGCFLPDTWNLQTVCVRNAALISTMPNSVLAQVS